MKILINLEPGAIAPTKAHPDDAGYDLYARDDIYINPGMRQTADTGVHFVIPRKNVGIVKNRSSMFGLGVITDGTIDAGYTGTVRVTLINTTRSQIHIRKGDRISQIVVLQLPSVELQEVDELPDTERGAGEFGSTGR